MYEIYSFNNGTVFCCYCPSEKTVHSATNLLTLLTNLHILVGYNPWVSWLADHDIDWKITTDSPEAFITDYPEYFI